MRKAESKKSFTFKFPVCLKKKYELNNIDNFLGTH